MTSRPMTENCDLAMSLPTDDERTVLGSGHAPQPRGADEPCANALPNGTRLGEFDITGLLGEGGFGIVYLAYDSSLERHVALKEYMPASIAARSAQARVELRSERCDDYFQAGLRSFVNEARILARFDHPSLIKVYRFWEANGTAYMVMPYYQGPTLKQALLAQAAPPDEAWLKGLLAPLLDTLALLHQQQLLHRDISPDNILMLEDGRPLLLDFGAARRAISGMTQAFTVIFKEGYAPIEQIAEMPGMQQGAWTDLFALASVAHFAIAGLPPPPAVARVISDPYVPLASRFADRYSVEFLAAIDCALAVKPEDRPQSAAQMRALLRLPEGVIGAPLPAAPLPAAPVAAHGRRPYLAAAGVAAGVLAASMLGYTVIGNKAPPARTASSATATAPSPAAAAAVAAPFDPVSALTRVLGGGSADRTVIVRAEKSRVRVGHDRLNFSVRPSHAGYVYVLMVGSDRTNFWLLFPNAVDKDNYVKAGQTLALPRKGWNLGVEGPAGIDQFVAIVSDVPRDFRAAGLVGGELFSEFPIARASQMQLSYTGATPLFAGVPDCAGAATCSPLYGAGMFQIEEFTR
jgi:tRNA A-37 threonylcarbamoyl transferase component Bud32